MPAAPAEKEKYADYCRNYLANRQRARTDLFFLANEILSPADSKIMTRFTHGPIVDHCQQFAGYREAADTNHISVIPKLVASEPLCALWDLEGERDRLILMSRGHLKTTIQTIAHSIQWIINYPNIRILLCTATDEKAQLIVGKIKQHFQFNAKFRWLFPEFCPDAKRVSDWGSRTEIRVPNATRNDEPTIMTAAVGKALASTHHDVIKCSDVVTENNVRTPGQIQEVKDFFGYMEPLRERGPSKGGAPNPGWKDVEGTLYDFGDYYQTVLDHQAGLPESERTWKITKLSCWVDDAKTQARWPEMFPPRELERIRNSPEVGPRLFASQYELEPVPPGDGLADESEIRFFPSKVAEELMPRYWVQTTVDLAGMDPHNPTADYSVFTVAGFQPDGKMDILSIQRGRFTLDRIVELFFLIQKMFQGNQKFKVQKDHFARVLEPVMRREMAKRRQHLWIEYDPISTTTSKVHRIKGLQGWFKMGLIRFSDSITCRRELVDEILRFPKGAHDDILDTIADHMHSARGGAISEVEPGEKPDFEAPSSPFEFNPYQVPDETDYSDNYASVTGL